MEILKTGKEDRMQTASGVTEGQSQNRVSEENEPTQSFRRGGRKVRSSFAHLGGEPDGSPTAQSAQALGNAASENSSQARVIISQDTSRYLDELAVKVNDGFDAGKVTRPQILSWVLRRFAETAGDDEIQELRAAHFDRIAYLEVLLKRAKETGVLPPELNAAIQPPSASAHAVKKSKKALTKNTINDDIIIDSKAAA